MGRALFTAVTGMKAQQNKLDVVANNIANISTTGYRSSRILFQDLFSQTLVSGSAPTATNGGTNPEQIGLGVQTGSIDVNHQQGSLVTTGVNSDLAVQGNGFFVLSNGTTNVYTRDGSFTVNSSGVLIDPATGLRVQGYTANANGVIDPANTVLGDINIPLGASGIAQATTEAEIVGNLNSGTAAGQTASRETSSSPSPNPQRETNGIGTRAMMTTGPSYLRVRAHWISTPTASLPRRVQQVPLPSRRPSCRPSLPFPTR